MLRSATDILGHRIQATDERIGHVSDFLIDDFAWAVRFLVVDTGFLLSGRTVLISPEAITGIDDDDRKVSLDLTSDQVRSAPGIDVHLPLSKQAQLDIAKHYGWRPYWETSGLQPVLGQSIAAEAVPDTRRYVEKLEQSDLRSLKEVSGYALHTPDGELGHAEDFLLEGDHWVIRYVVIDTRNWLPGKKVLISPEWIDRVVWADSEVHVSVPRQQIQDAPAYDADSPLGREEEKKLFEHYGKTPYWHGQEGKVTSS